MRNVEIAPATDEAVEYVAQNMRLADIAELWALSRLAPAAALHASVGLTKYPYVAYHAGEPLAIFGVNSGILGDVGVPWLLGTDKVRRHAGDLLAMTPQFLRHHLGLYRRLENEVHAENTDAVRYLTWAGFNLSEPYVTRTGAIARRFWMERNDV